MTKRPEVGPGVKLLSAPEGTNEDAYWSRVMEIRQTGVPYYNACRLARKEIITARRVRPRASDAPYTEGDRATLGELLERGELKPATGAVRLKKDVPLR